MKHRCITLPFHIVHSVVKQNGIVLNNIGNIFWMRTVPTQAGGEGGSGGMLPQDISLFVCSEINSETNIINT